MKKLLVILLIFFGCTSEPKDYEPDFNTQEGIEEFASRASIIARDYVKENLKSPSTAKFPFSNYSYSNPDKEKRIIGIKSYVDAQNSFGGTMRETYHIKLKFKSGDWADRNNWELISLIFE